MHHITQDKGSTRLITYKCVSPLTIIVATCCCASVLRATDPCELPAWNGTLIIDCETTDGWNVEVRGCPMWSVKPVSGLLGGAVQLNYECESDPASYIQAWYRFDPPVDLSNFDLFGISLRGSPASPNTTNKVRLMLADAFGVFFGATIGDIAHINRWLMNMPLPKELFTWQSWSPPPPIDWTRIGRLFVVVEQPEEGVRLLKGNLAIDHIQFVRSADWNSCAGFVPVAPDPVVAQKAVEFVVDQQCPTTGLFRSWSDDPDGWAWLYDQALALLILTRERRWEEADQLAAFLVANQKVAGDQGHWAIGWSYCDPAIEHMDDWSGDQAWAAYALHRYAILRGNEEALHASIRSGNWLAKRIRDDGCVDTRPRGTSSTEGNFDVWMAMMELGRTEDADRIAQCLLTTLWDKNMRYWLRGEGDAVVALNANTWPAKGFSLHPRINHPDMARAALGFVRRTLATRSDVKNICDLDFLGLCGLDFEGPITLHAEGMGSYVVAGGEESQEYLETLKLLQRADGGVPGATEPWKTDTHWLTCWKGIAPTAWLYFATSGSPFVDALNVLYVDADATGPYHDGSGWCNAFVYLRDALAVAADSGGIVTEIRVARGTYQPDRDSENPSGSGARQAAFQLVNGVALRGGYAGCGVDNPDERDIEAYETILSADLNGDDAPVECTEDADCERRCVDGACIISTNSAENCFDVVTGGGTDATAILDGFIITSASGSGMYNDRSSPTVSNCTFSGNSGGGMYNENYSNPTVTNCTFSGNSASEGGGMYNRIYSHPTVTNCTFDGNSVWVDGRGGGMWNSIYSNPTLVNCTFSGNSASEGGGMYNESYSNPTVDYCTFNANSAGEGGGMYNEFTSSPTVTNCTFNANSAFYRGGGMENSSSNPTVANCTFGGNSAGTGGGMHNVGSSPTVTNCMFIGNSADSEGGGMYNHYDSSPTVNSCTFDGNSAFVGGGMHNERYSNPTLASCTFGGNSANYGGGMYNGRSSPALTTCTFTGNLARFSGGGMYNQLESNPTVNSCTFDGNSAIVGGGMLNQNSSPPVTNCTFSGNSADQGGGMANAASSPAVTNCTFDGNSADDDGGGMYNSDSSPTMTNCTFAANLASNGRGLACDSSEQQRPSTVEITNCILWDGADEIWNNDGSTITITYSDVQGGWLGDGNVDEDPLFVDADGPDGIPGTDDDKLHLQDASLCINAGTDYAPDLPAEDLGGNPRIQQCRVDMGAYESPYPPPTFEDCNSNQYEDDCDIYDAASGDCNMNHVPDECDIAHGTSGDDDGDGVPDECRVTLDSSSPTNCAIDARQPSWLNGSNVTGWQHIELTFGPPQCDASTLPDGDFVIQVLPDGAVPTIDNVVRAGNTVTLEFSPFVELTKWTCFSHSDAAGQHCVGYLPADVNSDGTANPALDLGALIDCINVAGSCTEWQSNIDRTGTQPGVLDITRVIDLFNGAGEYESWTGASLPPCPSRVTHQ